MCHADLAPDSRALSIPCVSQPLDLVLVAFSRLSFAFYVARTICRRPTLRNGVVNIEQPFLELRFRFWEASRARSHALPPDNVRKKSENTVTWMHRPVRMSSLSNHVSLVQPQLAKLCISSASGLSVAYLPPPGERNSSYQTRKKFTGSWRPDNLSPPPYLTRRHACVQRSTPVHRARPRKSGVIPRR
ncbi:hypothetical protein GY45DRAFT_461405 [Cubamyces sp. BRFM 1775]|nr:hypothetical protein GY45DRAFT_461405 [Cubamyces sp. BRFM 1775]